MSKLEVSVFVFGSGLDFAGRVHDISLRNDVVSLEYTPRFMA